MARTRNELENLSDEELLELQEKAGGGSAPRQAKNFVAAGSRLLGLIAPHKLKMGLVLVLVTI
ncbi:hypothetical protein, partial [Corynebacterium sp.]|uniref:hypothetical protein n=1 Tax=Corynebacterium sp. TaxID=1720 RepID=UPI0037363634